MTLRFCPLIRKLCDNMKVLNHAMRTCEVVDMPISVIEECPKNEN